MSGSGTRRTTILKRRAAKTARLIFYAKRAGLTLAVIGGLTLGLRVMTHSDWFARVEDRTASGFHQKLADAGFKTRGLLIDGRGQTSREQLKAVLGIEKDSSIFSYDLANIQKKISTLPWVKTATVERRLPDTIYIRLQERKPVALYQKGSKLLLVDAEGVLLSDKNLGEFKDLLIVTGDHAPEKASDLAGMLQAEPDLKNRVAIARWIGNRRWDIDLKNGITVRLPEDDCGLAIKRLAEAQKAEKVMDRQVIAIDLRDPLRIVIQTTPGAVQKYEAGFKKQKNI